MDRIPTADVTTIALTLGGAVNVSRTAFERGDHSLRTYTIRGKARKKRGTDQPLYTGRALIHPAYK